MIKQLLVSSCVLFSATFVVQAQNPKLGVSPIQDVINAMTLDEKIQLVVGSTGNLKQLLGINQEVEGRHIIIVEDIVDTGFTMQKMIDSLKEKNPASINVCSLLVKPGNLRVPLDIKYAVMEIPNDFIVGYGLDYDQQGRNLRDIYTIVED
jgi:hypoxanthine phosphoribosyltransferase